MRQMLPMYGRPDTGGLLAAQSIVAHSATARPDRARAFYGFALGLMLMEDTPGALVFDAGGAVLRVAKVARVVAAPYPVLGWRVADIAATLRGLAARGVERVPIPGTFRDADGAWTAPDGERVAWFADPDGNILSLAEAPAP